MSGNKHIRATLPCGLVLVCFNQGQYFDGMIDPTRFEGVMEITGKLQYNTYNERTTVQFNGQIPQDVFGGISGRMNPGGSSAGLELLLWIRNQYPGANTGTGSAPEKRVMLGQGSARICTILPVCIFPNIIPNTKYLGNPKSLMLLEFSGI